MEVEFNDVPVKLVSGEIARVSGKIVIEDVIFDNDGIGNFEYWGFKGFDSGSDYVADFKTISLEHDHEDIAEITNLILEDALLNDDTFQKKVFSLIDNE